ncbi:MAG: HesA/MoeB/ThiF family protein [Legionellaceae bacterium]|nr:HesA/MoeB/ThiF family protein [Legionellaceae bacterium]
MLNSKDLQRYARQLPIIGIEGQQALRDARVLLVGAGGLGAPVALYLVAAGVGHLTVMDGDRVELSNLQRQVLFREADLGNNKALCMAERLATLHSGCRIHALPQHLDRNTSLESLQPFDVIVDASDNYCARYLINHFAHRLQIPFVSAALFQFEGQLAVFNYQQGPCYQCLYPAPPPADVIPDCAEAGILGAVAGMLGCLQATEIIKILLGREEVLSGKLLHINVLQHQYHTVMVSKHPQCQTQHGSIPAPEESAAHSVTSISAQALQEALLHHPEHYQLIDVRQDFERKICSLGGLFIPLHRLEEHLDSLPSNKILVVYCKKGSRSHKAAIRLKQHGYKTVWFLDGGILHWIENIDPDMQRY